MVSIRTNRYRLQKEYHMAPDEDKVLEAMQARYLQIMRMRNSEQEKPTITVYPAQDYEAPLKSLPSMKNRNNRNKRDR